MDGQFCLKWDGFQSSVTSLFDDLRQDQELVDITLCCEGQQIRAHRMMLSVCSPYFRDLLKNNPCQQLVLFLKDTSAADLRAVVEFMYRGSVNVTQSQLASFIKTAEMLQIRGLSGDEDQPAAGRGQAVERSSPAGRPAPDPPSSGGGGKRRRTSGPTPEPAAPPPPEPEPQPQPQPEQLKLEPVDLTEDDDVAVDAGLDATLGYVAEFEHVYAPPERPDRAPPAPAADTVSAAAPAPAQLQRPTEDGSRPVSGRHQCRLCGRLYKRRATMMLHMRKHQGLTACSLCSRVPATMGDLRRHLVLTHGLTREQARQRAPPYSRSTRPGHRHPPAAAIRQGQGLAGVTGQGRGLAGTTGQGQRLAGATSQSQGLAGVTGQGRELAGVTGQGQG